MWTCVVTRHVLQVALCMGTSSGKHLCTVYDVVVDGRKRHQHNYKLVAQSLDLKQHMQPFNLILVLNFLLSTLY